MTLFVGLCGFGLQASTISGMFQLNGIVTVTANTISWSSTNGPGTALVQNASGSFAAVNNTFADITTLVNPPSNTGVGAVGSPFPDTTFITFPSDPALGYLAINFIFPGVYGTAQCGAAPAITSPPQQCTPPIAAGTPGPFNMVNNPGVGGPQATITWVFSGNAYSGGSIGGTWNGNFTSQENIPYQTVLAQLASGSATNTFSESTLVISVGMPEGGTLALVGFGLVLMSAGIKRFGKRSNS